ncbi:MAG: AzlD domain-containing protein [Campylobacterota bacterium]|nr:AzlD domain-containing protein [Campylobacterota bacterium]
MSNNEIYLAIFVMAGANYATRIFPFLFFSKKEPPYILQYIGDFFPPVIMTILVFYSLGSVDFTTAPYGSKEILGIFITALLHWRFNNYLVSIIAGTAFYMILVQFL